jgi:Flp pilus assembly protein TadD
MTEKSFSGALPDMRREFDLYAFQKTIRDLYAIFADSDIAKKVSDDQVEVIYSIGHAIFMQGKFEKALSVFQVILLYRPLDSRVIEACATTLKKMGKFEEAIPTYAAAMMFGDLENPMPSIHIAECLAALGRADDSEKILRPLLDSAKLDSAFTDIRRRAENLLSMLRATN